MSPTRIGDEQWCFADAVGGEVRLAGVGDPTVPFPQRWRVFGPWGPELVKARSVGPQEIEPLQDAAVEAVTAIPEELAVGDAVRPGRDVDLDGDLLDLGRLYGTHDGRLGHQAYAMALLELDADVTLSFGAGCDWLMQWWVDGEKVLDTFVGGNRAYPQTHADHCAHVPLTAGRHLLVGRVISGSGGWTVRMGSVSPEQAACAKAALSNRWAFLPELGEIYPPYHPTLQNHVQTTAIRTDRCLADETIECEYRQPIHNGQMGIILGAQDNARYYFAYIPNWGQQHRARAFWACIGIVDASGHVRNLAEQLMPNVPVQYDLWKKLRVERRGTELRMSVNGVRGPCVTDDTYGPGYAGIGGYSRYHLRNLKIDGRTVGGEPWPEEDRCRQSWFLPAPEARYGNLQMPTMLCRLSDDQILMALYTNAGATGEKPGDEVAWRTCLFLSDDAGRSWAPHGEPLELPRDVWPPSWFVPRPGVIRSIGLNDDQMSCRDSTDKGLTWAEPVAGELLGNWDSVVFGENRRNSLINTALLRDGTLLGVILHTRDSMAGRAIPELVLGTWGGGPLLQPYCTRSTDQGRSWSQPVPMDDAHLYTPGDNVGPCGDFTETPMAELPSGRVVALSRPVWSPFCWQTHSDDGGRSWNMVCYSSFSGAGYPSLVTTASGYLVAVARGAGLEMHVSIDGGVNWDAGTMIDRRTYFNGATLEVEPDVLMVIYPESQNDVIPSRVRAQRIRVTPDGPVAED